MASAALGLLVAMKDQIVSRSWSASGRMIRRLAILLHSEFLRRKSTPPPHLDLFGKRLRIEFASRSAVKPLLYFRAQPLQLGFAVLLVLLDQAQPVTYDFAGRRVAAAGDQALDERLEVLADAVAGCHDHLRIIA